MVEQSVVVIIPAYNEERTVAGVVQTAKSCSLVNRVVVVSDGSDDSTVTTAREAGADIVELPENKGKGAAMKAGILHTTEDIILFMDADLIGLREKHIRDMLLPVIEEGFDTTVGLFESGRISTDLAQAVAPELSGQRAIKRSVLKNLDDIEESRYGVEIDLMQFIKANHLSEKKVYLTEMTHIMKEEKYGFKRGTKERAKMYGDILKRIVKGKLV